MTADPVAASADWLRAVRRGGTGREHETALRDWPRGDLRAALDTDDARLALWTNVYNAAAQSVLAASPEAYSEGRSAFFGAPIVTVAGRDLSLDDVEHGLLRRSHPKWTLGYVANPVAGAYERAFRVRERDPRVHFALNCGAAACPPVAAYTRDGIDAELDAATASYLDTEVEYDAEGDVARVPRLMLWFRGDFGGRDGILAMLREFDAIPAGASPRLRYRAYDWSLDAGNWG
ncbi:DUF547 domain-containing protein [Halosegnis marinus]|uniref:DUF547 domain-containing protein n=1 Tax=Halosegnis marinus TaxID=3034023 RepID=A0ABD5ZQF0_9EURY|nr:DUF547 domain-containing protein [Halosegnis sp. DT85]